MNVFPVIIISSRYSRQVFHGRLAKTEFIRHCKVTGALITLNSKSPLGVQNAVFSRS